MAYIEPEIPVGGTVISVAWATIIVDDIIYIYAQLDAAKKKARVYNSGDLTIPNNNATVLTFDSERYDNDTIHIGAALFLAACMALLVRAGR